jgi:hypothetical protein
MPFTPYEAQPGRVVTGEFEIGRVFTKSRLRGRRGRFGQKGLPSARWRLFVFCADVASRRVVLCGAPAPFGDGADRCLDDAHTPDAPLPSERA